MCAILDRNKFGGFLKPDKAGEIFRDWVGSGGGRIVYLADDKPRRLPDEIAGAMRRLLKEYADSPRVMRMLDQYRRAGRTRRVKLSEVAREYPATAKIRSNDRHILAMARASGARLLYTGDGALARHFRNPEIINNPEGVVYSRAAHQIHLRPDVCVPRPVAGADS